MARIFSGDDTSLQTLVWDGLKPITSRLSMRLSSRRNNFDRAMNLGLDCGLRGDFCVLAAE